MIYLPNHLHQTEISEVIEMIEKERSAPALRMIPVLTLTDEQRAVLKNIETHSTLGEIDRALNIFRLLGRPGQEVELQIQDMTSLMTRLKNANPSVEMACQYGQVSDITTNLPILGTALDKTLKYVVKETRGRRTSLDIIRKDFTVEDFKYPTHDPIHTDFVAYRISSDENVLLKENKYSDLFTLNESPLFFLGIAAKTLEGGVGVAATNNGTTITLFHPADYSKA